MIDEIGTVVELKGKHLAVVLCKKSNFCQNCASMESCQLGTDNTSKLVEAHNVIGAAVGDSVRLSVSTRSFLQSSLLLYGVPLVALVLGAGLGHFVGEQLSQGADPNLLSALFGISFMAGAFVTIKVGSRALSAENFMPRISEILSETDTLARELQKNGN